MSITFISNPISTAPVLAPSYEIHIDGFNMTGQGVKVLFIEETTAGGMAEIEFTRNRFMDLLFQKDAEVIIWIDKKNHSNPVFIGKLLEPTSYLHPSKTHWLAVNGIRELNLVPINKYYNRDNEINYNANQLTGFYLHDIAEDILSSAGGSIQFSKSSFPTDWIGETIVNGQRPIEFIHSLLDKSGQGKYSLRMKYNSDSTQSLEAWKFGSTNNNNTYIIPGTFNRNFSKSQRGKANINQAIYLEDCSKIINRIYAFGSKILVEATIQLTPSWNTTLEAALLDNGTGKLGSLLKDINPNKYLDVFQQWEFPKWRVYDSDTGRSPSEWKYVDIYPKIRSNLLFDRRILSKRGNAFILIHNPINIRGVFFFISPYNLWYTEEGFSIKKDLNGNEKYLWIDREKATYKDTDKTANGVKTKGELLFTGVFELPQRIWQDSGKQGQESEEHIEQMLKDDMKLYLRGYNNLGYNPNISGSDIFANSYTPIFTADGTLSSLDINSYVVRNDSETLRQVAINFVEYTKNRIKKILSVEYPRMDIAACIGDYEPYYQLNCIKIRHDFERFITIKDFSNA